MTVALCIVCVNSKEVLLYLRVTSEAAALFVEMDGEVGGGSGVDCVC